MSATNAIITEDAIHICTDGSACLMDGSFRGQAQKVAILAHLPCVIAARGSTMFPVSAAVNINSRFTSFDALLPEVPTLFRRISEQFEAQVRDMGYEDSLGGGGGEFMVAGWSDRRQRLEAYWMISDDRFGTGVEPWTLLPIQGLAFSPSTDAAMAQFRQVMADIGNVLEHPEEASLRFMEVQRGLSTEGLDGLSLVAAGEFCQLTTLRRDGISTKILKRWPARAAA